MKVLLVDDDPIVRKMLKNSLQEMYHVEEARNGKEALQRVAQDPSIRIVISDWIMPEMNGLELCRHLRKEYNMLIYILLLTSQNDSENIEIGYIAGANDYITKPFNPIELSAKLRAAYKIVSLEEKLITEKNNAQNLAQQMELLAEKRAVQLLHAEKMSSVGHLAAGIAHEINNPIGYVLNNLKVLEKYRVNLEKYIAIAQENSSEQERHEAYKTYKIEHIINDMKDIGIQNQEGIEKVVTIVKKLKTFSRIDEQGTMTSTDINDCIKSTLVIAESKVKYVADISLHLESTSPLIGIPGELNQVFLNLIINAAQAIEVSNTEKGVITISTWDSDHSVCCSIHDNGPGIPKEIEKKIFTPFFTTKEEHYGTGLGLSISQEIITIKHKGKITVCSDKNTGTEFLIELPKQSTID